MKKDIVSTTRVEDEICPMSGSKPKKHRWGWNQAIHSTVCKRCGRLATANEPMNKCERCNVLEAEVERMKLAFRSIMWSAEHKGRKLRIHKKQRNEAYDKIRDLKRELSNAPVVKHSKSKVEKPKHKVMCVVNVCEGHCCKFIDEGMAKKLRKHVDLLPNGDGTFTCLHSDKKTGICRNYKNRPLVCKQWFCESALFGYMQNAAKYFDNPITNVVVEK